MSMCDSHIVPPIVSVLREGSALTITRSRHGSGGCSSRALSALINCTNTTAPLGDVTRLPELVSHRKACKMVEDLERGIATTVDWGIAARGDGMGEFLYSATEGTESCALSLMRIVSS